MMPAQLVAEAVAVLSYAGSKAFYLPHQSIPIEMGEVFVHVVLKISTAGDELAIDCQLANM